MKTESFTVIPFGAILQRFIIDGKNLVLGFNDPAQYANNPPYFGSTIGRTANRIANARINDLNGKSYELYANDGKNSLHGGRVGWNKKLWDGPHEVTRADGKTSYVYKLIGENMDEGYPGEVEVLVKYIPYKLTENGVEKEVLEIEYEARLTDNQPADVTETVINLTNHSYFNLSGAPTITGTRVTLITNKYLEVDDGNIPTGPISNYPGINPGEEFVLCDTKPVVDNCFIHNTDSSTIPLDTRGENLYTAVSAHHPDSGIHLEVATTEPSFQFYTGEHIDEKPREDGSPARIARGGFAVEPSRFVNAVNYPEWRNQVVVKEGETYGSRILFKAWKA